MLYFRRFWKVSGGIVWFIKGSGRFECQSVPALPNYSISLSNRCPVNHFGAQGAQKHQSFQSISFHYQIDPLGSISELKPPRAPETSLFISKWMPFRWESRTWDVDWFGSLGPFEVELIEIRFVYQGIPMISMELWVMVGGGDHIYICLLNHYSIILLLLGISL